MSSTMQSGNPNPRDPHGESKKAGLKSWEKRKEKREKDDLSCQGRENPSQEDIHADNKTQKNDLKTLYQPGQSTSSKKGTERRGSQEYVCYRKRECCDRNEAASKKAYESDVISTGGDDL